MSKMKVMTIIGTRPEIIRLSEVIKKCDLVFDHTLVNTGQNWDYSLNEVFFHDLGLRKPDYILNVVGNNLGQTMGNIISYSYDVLLKKEPDALLILGDTNSALSAISAKRLKIPIFHMEAGNRCFDVNAPEEINRRIVDHVSDINLPYTEHSRRYLINEGFKGDFIFVTGSPMPEVIDRNITAINNSNIVDKLNLDRNKYLLVSAHREENIDNDKNFLNLIEILNSVADEFVFDVIYSTHPRSMKRIENLGIEFNSKVKIHTPFSFSDYNALQRNAYCVLSDSGTLSEESAILNFPAVLIRNSTERPEALDKGTIVIGGVKKDSVIESIKLVTQLRDIQPKSNLPQDYYDKNISDKVVKIIQSYTHIVNEKVWFR